MMLIIFYSSLVALCVYMEASTKINTDNILNKIAIGLVMIGALLGIYKQCYGLPHQNNLIDYGVFLHFICELRFAMKPHKRRASDNKITQ